MDTEYTRTLKRTSTLSQVGSVLTMRLVQEIILHRNTDMLYCASCLIVMKDASGRLFQSLFDAYDDKWDGVEDLGEVVEVSVRDHIVRQKFCRKIDMAGKL